MRIIKERHVETYWKRYIDFDYGDGSGFRFPCDESGEIIKGDMSDEALANYKYALSHPELFEVYNEFVAVKNTYIAPAIGECVCGEQFPLEDQYMGACKCPKCGRWYNIFGQALLSPEYWEE